MIPRSTSPEDTSSSRHHASSSHGTAYEAGANGTHQRRKSVVTTGATGYEGQTGNGRNGTTRTLLGGRDSLGQVIFEERDERVMVSSWSSGCGVGCEEEEMGDERWVGGCVGRITKMASMRCWSNIRILSRSCTLTLGIVSWMFSQPVENRSRGYGTT